MAKAQSLLKGNFTNAGDWFSDQNILKGNVLGHGACAADIKRMAWTLPQDTLLLTNGKRFGKFCAGQLFLNFCSSLFSFGKDGSYGNSFYAERRLLPPH